MSGDTFDADLFNAFEAAGWEGRADAYGRFFEPVTSRVVDTLADAAAVGPGTRVLDVCTGPGNVAALCAGRGATVVGIDAAAQMVALAGRLHPGIEFRQADAEQLPFDEASFDAVVANFGILHLGRPEHAAAGFARVLSPGGRLALSTWDTPDQCRLIGVVVDAVAEVGAVPPTDVPAGPPFFRFSDESAFRDLLAGAGLEDVRVETVRFRHTFPDADALWGGLLGATVRTRSLVLGQPAEVQGQIRAAFDRLVGGYVTDGEIDLPVSVKLASGRRPATQARTG
jgi:SAM-dependent methyltransferase